MSTLRISNIEAKADSSSPTVDEQLKFTNSDGDVLLHLDGRTAGITTVGINTTNQTIKFDANNNILITGIVTATEFHGSLAVGTSVTYGDNEKAYFGNGLDLSLFHDGSNAYVTNISGTIHIQGKSGENSIRAIPDGAVELYYNNTKRIETTNTGATVTGSLLTTGNISINNVAPKIFLTDSDSNSDFSIRNMHGVFGIHDQTNSVDRLTINSNGNITVVNDLDVDGHTNLDNVSIAGVTTSAGIVQAAQFKLLDNAKAIYGNSGDMEIYHNATNSLIQNGTGSLQIVTTTGGLFLRGQDNITFNTAGNNERARILSGGEFAIGGSGYAGQPFSLQTSSTNLGYMETTSTTRGVMSFRDGNSTQNVGFGCIGNNHVFMKDGTERVRITSTGKVLIGHDTPTEIGVGAAYQMPLQVIGGSYDTSGIVAARYYDNNAGPHMSFVKSRNNTLGSQTIVQVNDTLGMVRFFGSDGTDAQNCSAAMRVFCDATPASNKVPGRIVFETTDTLTYPRERMRIDSSGRVVIGGPGSNAQASNTYIGGGALAVLGTPYTPNTYACFAMGRVGANVTANTTITNIRLNGGTLGTGRGAEINATADANWSDASSHPTRLTFHTVASSSTSSTERLRITSMGDVYAGNDAGYAIFDNSTIRPRFQFRQGTGTNRGFALIETRGDANSMTLYLAKSREGPGTGVINSGDQLGSIAFAGADGTNQVTGAQILGWTSGTIAADRIPTNLSFYTHPDSTAGKQERLRITASGNTRIGVPPTTGSSSLIDEKQATIGTKHFYTVYHNFSSTNSPLAVNSKIPHPACGTVEVVAGWANGNGLRLSKFHWTSSGSTSGCVQIFTTTANRYGVSVSIGTPTMSISGDYTNFSFTFSDSQGSKMEKLKIHFEYFNQFRIDG